MFIYAIIPFLKEKYPGVTIIETPDELSALLETSFGRSDGSVIDFMTASYLVDTRGITNLKFGIELDYFWKLRFACRKELGQLTTIIDKVIGSLSESEKNEIFSKWIRINEIPRPSFFVRYRIYILGLILFGTFLLATMLIFTRILVTRVRRRTKELKHAWDTVRESERNFRNLFEKHEAVKLIIDPEDGNIVDANHSAARFYGWTVAELRSMNISQINTLSTEAVRAELEQARTPSGFHFEFIHRKADGSLADVEVYSSIVEINGKDMLHSIIHEITVRKQVERNIQKRLKMESMLARISEAAVIFPTGDRLMNRVLEDAGSTISASRAYIFEHDLDSDTMNNTYEWCGEGVIPCIDTLQGIPAGAVPWWTKTLQTSERICVSDINDIPDEKAREMMHRQGVLSILVVPLYLKGKYHGFIGFDDCEQNREWPQEDIYLLQSVAHIVTNLFERRSSEAELRIKDQAFESSPTALALADLKGKLTYVNPAFIKCWEFTHQEDLRDKYIKDFLFYPELAEEMFALIKDKGIWLGEVSAFRADGSPFEVEIHASLVNDPLGQPVCVLATFVDITDRKRWEQELIKARENAEQVNRLKSAFLANLSHEIRTPMNGILGFLDIIQDMDPNAREKDEYIQMVQKSGQRLLDTVNDIIEMSKIESGEIQLRMEKSNICEIMKFLYDFFKPQSDEKQLNLVWVSERGCSDINVMTDRIKLESILTNLIGNAIKFTDHGTVEFGCVHGKDSISFFVRDTGRGIPPQMRDLIFERFVQADNGYSRWQEGSGLGLAIARAYAEKLGGTISVESKEGYGSTFTVKLPF